MKAWNSLECAHETTLNDKKKISDIAKDCKDFKKELSRNNSSLCVDIKNKLKETKIRKVGVSLIALVITIIVIIILAAIIMIASHRTVGQANYAKFVHELSEVQDKVTIKRTESKAEGVGEELKDKEFTKVHIENAPEGFVSFDNNAMTGYWVDMEKINEKDIPTGHEELIEEKVKFGESDVYVYDAKGTVYYARGWIDENEEWHYSIEKGEPIEGPKIESVTYDLTSDKTRALVKVVAIPANGGTLNVMIDGKKAINLTGNEYTAEITKNGSIRIVAEEAGGGNSSTSITITGIDVEDTTAPVITGLTSTSTTTNIVIKGNAKDDESKIVGYKFTDSQVEPTAWEETNANSISATYNTSVSNTYYFWVKNEEGLVSSQKITVELKKVYTITYNANGGNLGNLPSSEEKTQDASYTISNQKPSKEGYEFQGWAISEANATAGTVKYNGGETYTENENLELYAVWKETTVAVNSLSVETIGNQVYTGNEIRPTPQIKDGSTTLTNGIHYTLSYSNNTNVGTATITIIGKGKYTGTKTVTFEITAKEVKVEWSNTTFTYDGTSKVPMATVTGVTGETITLEVTGAKTAAGTNYTATASIKSVTGGEASNYKLTNTTTTFSISKARMSITATGYSGTYDGASHGIKLSGTDLTGATVKYGETSGNYTLTSTPTYKDVNNYTVYFKVTKANYEDYTGSATVVITKKDIAVDWTNTKLTYNGASQAPTATAAGIAGETIKLKVDGAKTNVGKNYSATATIESVTNGKASNYNLTNTTTKFDIALAEDTTITGTIVTNAYTYDGKEYKPEPTVTTKLNGTTTTLVKDTDYTVTYSTDVTNVGNKTITITGKGNYAGVNTTVNYAVVAKNIADLSVTLTPSTYEYNGEAKEPEATIVYDSKDLVKGTDFTIAYTSNTTAGQAMATITGKGNFTGTKEAKFTINKAEFTVTTENYAGVYDGASHEIKIKVDGITDVSDATITYGETAGTCNLITKPTYKDIGDYTVYYKVEKANYETYTSSATVSITAKTVSVDWSDTNLVFNNVAQVPKATATGVAGETINIKVDGAQTNVGKEYSATASIESVTNGKPSNYNLTNTTTKFNISLAEDTTITGTIGTNAYTYDGKEHKPEPTVTTKLNGTTTTLVKDTDYTVTYGTDVTNVGNKIITITGKGNYAGVSTTVSYTINKATITITPKAGQTKVYGAAEPKLTYTSSGAQNSEVPGFTGSLAREAGDNVGEYVINKGSLALADNGTFKASNYNVAFSTTTVKFTITAKDIKDATITINPTSFEYDGTAKEPAIAVKLNEKTLSRGTEYTVKVENNVNAGTATVTVTGINNYAGTKTTTFTILEKKYTITYNVNGGDLGNVPVSQEKTHGKAYTITTKEPTKEGYTFMGWATSEVAATAGTVAYNAGDEYVGNADLTLYAVWKKIVTVEGLGDIEVSDSDVELNYDPDTGDLGGAVPPVEDEPETPEEIPEEKLPEIIEFGYGKFEPNTTYTPGTYETVEYETTYTRTKYPVSYLNVVWSEWSITKDTEGNIISTEPGDMQLADIGEQYSIYIVYDFETEEALEANGVKGDSVELWTIFSSSEDSLENAVYLAAYLNKADGKTTRHIAMWNGTQYEEYDADADIKAIDTFTENYTVTSTKQVQITAPSSSTEYVYVPEGSLKAEKGMTWKKWLESEYNTTGETEPLIKTADYEAVSYEDAIVAGKDYGFVVCELSGRWIFNDILNFPENEITQEITYTVDYEYYDIRISPGMVEYYRYEPSYYDGWVDESFKTINFGTEPQVVSKEFYEWFTANATKVPLSRMTIYLSSEIPEWVDIDFPGTEFYFYYYEGDTWNNVITSQTRNHVTNNEDSSIGTFYNSAEYVTYNSNTEKDATEPIASGVYVKYDEIINSEYRYEIYKITGQIYYIVRTE